MNAYSLPTEDGHFENFGGIFIAETLMAAVDELKQAYQQFGKDSDFLDELASELKHYVGRPTPLYFAEQLTKYAKGANIYLKREDLTHTGAHKINNTVGQILLAKRMGKKRVIAETGAGQHGVATATIAAKLGIECVIYMGQVDMTRQAPNVYRMRVLGAQVVCVESGSKTLKDAMNEAMRDWVTHIDTTYYVIGSVAGPHPYPMMVRDFQSIIGTETKQQFAAQIGGKPDALVACVGGGSNALGLFYPFMDDKSVQMFGVEAAGYGIEKGKQAHAATLCAGAVGVLHGTRTYLLTDENGQIIEGHSISAGLDYPGVGPEHAYLKESGRVKYDSVTDNQALEAFFLLSKTEGILPALESSHAISYAVILAKKMGKGKHMVVNLSGRGDKDINTVADIKNIHL